jgi:hypothetical protein
LFSEVLGYLFEVFQRSVLARGERFDRVFQAVVNMVLDKHTLGLANGFFHGMQLLSDVDAGPAVFDHGNDAAQVALRTPQPFDDVLMTLVLMTVFVIAHALSLMRR